MEKIQHYVQGHWTIGTEEGLPVHDAITGEAFTSVAIEGLDIPEILNYGRTKGGEQLRKMTFQERGNMLKKLALYLTKRKDAFYELSYRTGATKVDSWIDIEGGFGNLFANASLRKLFPNQPFHVEGDPVDLSRGGRFMAHHIMVPKKGVAVHINAFNFPVWGMLEKCAVNWMAGVPAVVLPAPSSSYLAEAVARTIIDSGILPEGALQIINGTVKTILDTVESQDVVTFTGSAATGRLLKAHPRLIQESVPFTMEADSLNASILGEDAVPGTPEFDLFIKEVRKEMTVKAGQKCTAIRRIIVPENLVEDVQIALGKALDKVTIGDPRLKEVRMGSLVSKQQVQAVRDSVNDLAKEAQIVYGDLDKIETIGADAKKGAFISPILLRADHPFDNTIIHEREAFGPVSTIMPYKTLDEAVTLAQMGKGSLVSSIATNDDNIARDYVVNAASHHGRILVLNRESAKESTGHGSPLPYLVHGGPGRAGGGEEMGGMRGIKHYLQRTAIQGSPTTITEITGIYQQNAAYKEAENHPFKYHWEDIQPGMSLKTHKRTITDSDIINFANITWDHFYAHTDITSLDGSIFQKRTAHGYFIISAAAGLFVYPNKGPVAANYGLDTIRFLRPLYHNDTIYVRLTCKEKVDRDVANAEHPSGIVKWHVEVFDANFENRPDSEKGPKDSPLVAVATILTMVQKKQETFVDIDRNSLESYLNKLSEDSKPLWGNMTPQHMLEHLEYSTRISSGEIQDIEIATPEKILEKVHATIYNYDKMPRNFGAPERLEKELEQLKHENLDTAKQKLLEAFDNYVAYFKAHPEGTLKNIVFGDLNRYEWNLFHRKHYNHHFEQFGLL
ncbi:phenylacetic acid degradation bifunctional protein PaaZ [Psychroserpens sp.]|uniref:phenylacetic acid degradation bifunctional protein PaaZ n=1 Tax=Psychroserpens sp. TaxID=2020870 RepID=UPI001B14FA51|nr:phenylacetic acid degradation bifunctional protein PaaZ [Psychroserpens sp.]MBO6607977.1 phenylacetic acid degradation bifunctional protein PaaZ [Psychroserpens sp.]MBO6631562.1 phenylacetic acid degradation bifunctional protein PaaZ [Psychroserpens sp.]MBO6654896.1 phenylacetic acid degradation bifunctional protein PaaZ [Psychroserpens sp.]MBO6683030.1 phenylacetic acid degradation bifunctional protein PaaZ [Psychroserpens sp.]MBO6751335.1 phenylacetic acid degradation bifunctional protein